MLIDLKGRRALVAGVADDRGFGFAIARSLAQAGASVCVGCWPPAYRAFNSMLRRGKLERSCDLGEGRKLEIERVYPLDARFDERGDVPDELRTEGRYRECERFTVQEVAQRLLEDFGPLPLDVVVHCVAHAPELAQPFFDTSRRGYLAAVSASSFSFVALAQRMSPLMRSGGSLICLSYIAAQRVIPGYGGGMSAAKAALENDTGVLSFELGRRHGLRVNCISAGPGPSRAASPTGFIDFMVSHVAHNSPISSRPCASSALEEALF
jgi:enoyl-[acyl-carrier protein] reductase I